MGSTCGKQSKIYPVQILQSPVANNPIDLSKLHSRSLSENISSSRISTNRGIIWKRGNQIGCGVFGKVYQAMNMSTGELLAVKTISLSVNKIKLEKDLVNIKRELDILKSIDHPNIIKYFQTDYLPETGCIDILMEYIPSGSMNLLISKYKGFSESVIRNYTKQLLLGLEYLHSRGIVHRDLKSANLLITEDGTLKLTDFGCSRRFDEKNAWSQSFKGSPYWMAPEVVLRKKHTFLADIWSVGCLVIEMASGRPPWSNYSTQAKEVLKLIAEPNNLPVIPAVTRDLEDFLEKCLQRNPDYRLTAKELLRHRFLTAEGPPKCYSSIRASSYCNTVNTSIVEKTWRRQESL